jgi:hypothetical protein
MVHIEGRAPDSTALQFGPAHASADPFYDQGSFQFSNGADNYDYRPAERTLSVNGLALRMELDPKSIQLVEHLKKMSRTAREPITRPNQHGIEAASMRILEQSVKGRTSDLGTADPMINVFFRDFVAALPRELAQFDGLCLGVLIKG